MSEVDEKILEMFYTASVQQQIRQIEEMLKEHGFEVTVSIEKELPISSNSKSF